MDLHFWVFFHVLWGCTGVLTAHMHVAVNYIVSCLCMEISVMSLRIVFAGFSVNAIPYMVLFIHWLIRLPAIINTVKIIALLSHTYVIQSYSADPCWLATYSSPFEELRMCLLTPYF
jgi:hypothetical protein